MNTHSSHPSKHHVSSSNTTQASVLFSPPHLSGYILGFVVSLVLTWASFEMAFTEHPNPHAWMWVLTMASLQLVAQSVFFLHLSLKKAYARTTWMFLCTMVVWGIVLWGSTWILHAQHVMMGMPH